MHVKSFASLQDKCRQLGRAFSLSLRDPLQTRRFSSASRISGSNCSCYVCIWSTGCVLYPLWLKRCLCRRPIHFIKICTDCSYVFVGYCYREVFLWSPMKLGRSRVACPSGGDCRATHMIRRAVRATAPGRQAAIGRKVGERWGEGELPNVISVQSKYTR